MVQSAEAGGSEPTFPDMIDTWIELAWQDGSLGWIGIANLPSAAACAAYLPDDGFAEVFTGNDHRVTAGGQFFPNGLGETVDGGYRSPERGTSARGPGTPSTSPPDSSPPSDGEMVLGDDGLPPLMVAVIPRDEIVFTDGWHVQGLKGTGSYDYNVTDLFVPAAPDLRAVLPDPPPGGSPAFRMGLMPITAAGHASWALGVAKSMIDDVTELAADQGAHGRGRLHRPPGLVPAEPVPPPGHVEGGPIAGRPPSTRWRRQWRRRSAHPDHAGRHAGGRHLRHRGQPRDRAVGPPGRRHLGHPRGKPPGRAFRDMYTGTQHVFIGEKTYIDAAQIQLGLIDDQFGLERAAAQRGRLLRAVAQSCRDFDLEVLLRAEGPELPPVARLLVAAERRHRVEPAPVDLDLAGPQLPGHLPWPVRGRPTTPRRPARSRCRWRSRSPPPRSRRG